MGRFDPVAVRAKIEHLYSKGLGREAKQVLLEPWPGMDDDIDCLYEHLFLEARHGGKTHLFLQSSESDGENYRIRFPDWAVKAEEDFIGRYGEFEGRLRYQKALAIYSARLCEADGRQNLAGHIDNAAKRLGLARVS